MTSEDNIHQCSSLWNEVQRSQCSESKLPDHEINKIKEQLLYQDDTISTVEST